MTQQTNTLTRVEVEERQRRVAALSAKQLTALRRLGEGRSFKEVAQLIGVSRSTLHRWRTQEPDFKAALQAWNADALDGARHRLVAIADEAVTAVCSAVSHGDAKLAMAVLKVLGIAQRPAREPGEPKEPRHATEEPGQIDEAPGQIQDESEETQEETGQIEEAPAVSELPDVRRLPTAPALADRVDATGSVCTARDAAARGRRDEEIDAAPADAGHAAPTGEGNEARSIQSSMQTSDSAVASPAASTPASSEPTSEDATEPSGMGSMAVAQVIAAPADEEPIATASESHQQVASHIVAASNAETPAAVAATPSPYAELMRWRQMPFEQRSPAIERRIRDLQTQVEAARSAEVISAAGE